VKLRNVVFCLLFWATAFLTPLYAQGDPKYTSPRILALQKELEAGNGTALEKFWDEIAKQGTPIIEPALNSDTHRLVTFLWREKRAMRWALLLSDLTESDRELRSLIQLRDTDVWYRTVRVRNDARFAYGFGVDPGDPLPRESKPFEADPWNPRRALPGGPFASLCELPGAPPQPWITPQTDAPAGQVEWKTFKSEILKNEREIGVYTPPNYQANSQPYGLLLAFDGRTYTTTIPTSVILDNLLAKKLLPPLVAVFIANTKPSKRSEELSCNAAFADFLAKELVPWVRQNYRVTTDPNQTIIAGSSLGGLAASFTALRHPTIFGNVLSQSGSYGWKPKNENSENWEESEWLTKQFVTSPKLPVRFYIEAGLLESVWEPGLGTVSLLAANRHLRDVLLAKGYAVHYREFNGGHDYINWRGTLADGLLLLLGKDTKGKKDK
jgi:enterochelin esterase-like enzyme